MRKRGRKRELWTYCMYRAEIRHELAAAPLTRNDLLAALEYRLSEVYDFHVEAAATSLDYMVRDGLVRRGADGCYVATDGVDGGSGATVASPSSTR